MQADPNCREDAEHSILVSGEVNEPLVAKVASRILELRASCSPRITVYINSVGGRIDQAEALEGLLTCRSPSGYCPRIITVAFGDAKSAAASLLAMGDYAIAYPNASIHFHGARYFGEFEVTTEFANSSAEALLRRNLLIAMKLAEKSVHRSVLRFIELSKEFDRIRHELQNPNMTDLACFAELLANKVYSPSASKILDSALKYSEEIEKLGKHVYSEVEKVPREFADSESPASYESRILKSIIDYELNRLEDETDGLTSECVTKIFSDYSLLRDYHLGVHKRALRSLCNRHGRVFLKGGEFKEYDALSGAPSQEREDWLEFTVLPRMQPFWYFVVCVWRALQREENPISPQDAYWLGIVDEVAGTRLAAHRLAIELSGEDEIKPAR